MSYFLHFQMLRSPEDMIKFSHLKHLKLMLHVYEVYVDDLLSLSSFSESRPFAGKFRYACKYSNSVQTESLCVLILISEIPNHCCGTADLCHFLLNSCSLCPVACHYMTTGANQEPSTMPPWSSEEVAHHGVSGVQRPYWTGDSYCWKLPQAGGSGYRSNVYKDLKVEVAYLAGQRCTSILAVAMLRSTLRGRSRRVCVSTSSNRRFILSGLRRCCLWSCKSFKSIRWTMYHDSMSHICSISVTTD